MTSGDEQSESKSDENEELDDSIFDFELDDTLLFDNLNYDMNKICSSIEVYQETEENIKTILKNDLSKRKNNVNLILNGKTFEMTLGKLFVNILLMRPFAELGVDVCEDDIFDGTTVTQDVLDSYFNHIVERFRKKDLDIDYDKIRNCISNAMNEMCDISGDINIRMGNSISYRDLIRLEVEDPEFNELVHPTVKPGQFHDIEKQFANLGKKVMNYFSEHKDTELHPFVVSETGINKKQFTQAIGFVGLKPSMTGEVIPVTITDNFLRGLSGLESYYINACGTKKALQNF